MVRQILVLMVSGSVSITMAYASDLKDILGGEPIVKRAKLQTEKNENDCDPLLSRFCSEDHVTPSASLSPCFPADITKYILSFITNRQDLDNLSLVNHGFCNYVDERPHLSVSQNITDEGLVILLKHKTKLASISLANRNRSIDRGLKALSSKRRTLVSLNLEKCSLIRDVNLVNLAGDFPMLTKIVLHDTNVSDGGLERLAGQAPCLDSLNVWGCGRVSYTGLLRMARLCPSITTLNMVSCVDSGDDSFRELFKSLPKMTTLFVGGPSITGAKLEIISMSCGQLKSLHLWQCINVYNKDIQSITINLSKLRDLDLIGCPLITGEGLGYGCGIHLSSLRLSSCRDIIYQGLINLASSFPNITRLELNGAPYVNDQGVIIFLGMLSRLSYIDLTGLGVTDLTVEAMTALFNLETLILSATNISDRGLDIIVRNFPKLAKFRFDACRYITDMGIARMKASRPEIEFKGYVRQKVAINLQPC